MGKIPLPLRSFTTWSGDVLHFASDDLLETYVKAAYDPNFAKTPFKEAVEAIELITEEKGFQARETLPTSKQGGILRPRCSREEPQTIDATRARQLPA